MSASELIDLYETLYRKGDVKHPKKGWLSPYGSHTDRDQWFIQFISSTLPPSPSSEPPSPITILDASCGRGHLASSLSKLGYKVSVTEVSRHIVKKLKVTNPELSPIFRPYEDYHLFPDNSFDCVISNDVLEHLVSPRASINAIEQLCRISKKWVLTSIGLGPARNFPMALKLKGIDSLHTVIKPHEWWIDHLTEHIEPVHTYIFHKKALFFFGVKREEEE